MTALAGFWSAVRFLTRVPLPRALPGDWQHFGKALAWFPVVGLLLGILLAAADSALRLAFSPSVASVLVVLLLLALSGALHADGLADTADALFSHASPERRLEIMRDPRVGTFGAAALVAVLLLKVAALEAVPPPSRPGTLLLAPVLGRWAIVALATLFPYGRPDGLGAPLRAAATRPTLLAATAVPLLAGVPLGLAGVLLVLIAAVTTLLLGRWMAGKLPGLTGDCYGFGCEMVETVVLVLAAPLVATLRA